MDEFESQLANAFRAPMDRPAGADVAASVEARLRLHDRLRLAAVVGGGFAGLSVCAGALSAAHALDALPGLLRLAGSEAAALLPRLATDPLVLGILGVALLAAVMARVAARDL
jgi:hypothetical protein